VAEAAGAAGVKADEAERLWGEICRRRVPPASDGLTGAVGGQIEIVRDAYGVPHVYAEAAFTAWYIPRSSPFTMSTRAPGGKPSSSLD
jgi:hypothetical protein